MKIKKFLASYGYSYLMCDRSLARIIESTSMPKPFSSREAAEKAVKAFCSARPHEVDEFEIKEVELNVI